jgi:hypothetical protein
MDKFLNSTKFIILLTAILLCLGATACVKPKLKTDQPKQQTSAETIGNLEAIGTVLGCMFDPIHCPKKKELAETEDIK